MTDDLTRTSKFLSYLLRHQPEEAGLTLDPAGWAPVDAVLDGLRQRGYPARRAILRRLAQAQPKQRFELSEDGTRIRARYGHSVDVELGLSPEAPPDQLYHGTAKQTIEAIMREGLRPQSRQHVHLSPDIETARSVGQRHGPPAILVVDAQALWTEGHRFYHAGPTVWLTEFIPPDHLSLMEQGR